MFNDPTLEPEIHFLPQALDPDGKPWTVREVDGSDASVDLSNKIASVPRARTRASEQIRLHEMAHVGYSDNHQHDIDMATFICRMLEEVRVDAILYKERGIDVRHRHDDLKWDINELEKTPFAKAMAWLQTAFMVTNPNIPDDLKEFNALCWAGLAGGCRDLLTDARLEIVMDPLNIPLREQHVKKLLKYFMPPPPKPPEAPKKKKQAVIEEEGRQAKAEREEAREITKVQAQKSRKPSNPLDIPEPTEAELDARRALGKSPEHGIHMFGGAEVHDHVARLLKVTHVKAPFTQTGRGMVPEFMENFLVNRRIFRTEHRGGVIVLDCSGSMSPNFDLITAQMQDFPNLVVLSYVSTTHNRATYKDHTPTGINGRICVHARNGRIDPVFQKEPGWGGGNSVDIEALDYGAKFKGPRIWVSDGFAHSGNYDTDGMSGTYRGAMQTKVREVMKKNHYIRVTNLDDALAWVNRSRPVLYYLCGSFDENAPGAQGQNHTDVTGKDTRKERRP